MSRFKQPTRPHDVDTWVNGSVAPQVPETAPPAPPKPALSRLTVDIPMDLHRQLKATCATSGTTMGDTIATLIREWIEKGQPT